MEYIGLCAVVYSILIYFTYKSYNDMSNIFYKIYSITLYKCFNELILDMIFWTLYCQNPSISLELHDI